jgi:hypothetical protein
MKPRRRGTRAAGPRSDRYRTVWFHFLCRGATWIPTLGTGAGRRAAQRKSARTGGK